MESDCGGVRLGLSAGGAGGAEEGEGGRHGGAAGLVFTHCRPCRPVVNDAEKKKKLTDLHKKTFPILHKIFQINDYIKTLNMIENVIYFT